NAQDFKKVQTALLLNKLEDAKTEIDKLSAEPKAQAKAETYYYKSRVYAALIKDPVASTKYPNLVADADMAIQKLLSLDPGFVQIKEKGPDAIFDLYTYGFNNGIRSFNGKKWDSACVYFGIAVTYSDILFQNKLTKDTTMAFDTTSILYAGYSGQNATKPEFAVKYYKRLADSKVATEGYLDVYKFLVITYLNDKNEADFRKYLAVARYVYPKEDWNAYEVEYLDRNFSLKEKTNYYDSVDHLGKFSEMEYLQFGEIFVNVKHDTAQKSHLDSLQLIAYEMKGVEAYKKGFAKNNQNAIASFNVGVIYYNYFGLLDDQVGLNIREIQKINSSKPSEKDPKKKAAVEAKFKALTDQYFKANADLVKPINGNIDQAIEWLEKTYTIEKGKVFRNSTNISIGNKTVDFLANMYQYKRDQVRGKDNKAFEAFEAKYKLYDSEHDSFVAIRMGATKEEVRKEYGEPKSISTTSTRSGVTELYIYSNLEIGFDSKGLVNYGHELK
ncbi:MAG: hypothetical protein WCO28_12455, partial [Bacteroidota bacterium]